MEWESSKGAGRDSQEDVESDSGGVKLSETERVIAYDNFLRQNREFSRQCGSGWHFSGRRSFSRTLVRLILSQRSPV
jgi:hypothetical protein